jgi:hypothetical protein
VVSSSTVDRGRSPDQNANEDTSWRLATDENMQAGVVTGSNLHDSLDANSHNNFPEASCGIYLWFECLTEISHII